MKRKLTKKQWIAFVIASLIPVIILLFGCFLLYCGSILNVCFAITYLALPVLITTGLYFVLSSALRNGGKAALCLAVLGVGIFLILQMMMYGYFELLLSDTGEAAVRSYENDETVSRHMPSIDEIGEPTHLEFHDYYSQMSIFTCDADVLIAAYDENTYAQQKAVMEANYFFSETPLTSCGHNCETSCQMDGFHFRIVAPVEGEWFPRSFMLIATNDHTREIVYLCFYDDDLDYIDSLEEFLKEDCGWEHIR